MKVEPFEVACKGMAVLEDLAPVRLHLPPVTAAPHPRSTLAVDVVIDVAPAPAAPALACTGNLAAAASAGRWAALREFSAQAVGSLAGAGLRWGLARATPAGAMVGGVVAAAGLGACVARASGLAAHALHPEAPPPWAWRLALAIVPLAATATAVGAVGAGVGLQATGALLAGRLAERVVRELASGLLEPALPAAEIIDADGSRVDAALTGAVDAGRAWGTAPLTLAATFTGELLLPVAAGALGAGSAARAALAGAGSSALEALRAWRGTRAGAATAMGEGWSLRLRPAVRGREWAARALSSRRVARSLDAAGMRQAFGTVSDLLDTALPSPHGALAVAGCALARAQVKTLGELRSPLVARGQVAQARAAQSPSAVAPGAAGEGTGLAYR